MVIKITASFPKRSTATTTTNKQQRKRHQRHQPIQERREQRRCNGDDDDDGSSSNTIPSFFKGTKKHYRTILRFVLFLSMLFVFRKELKSASHFHDFVVGYYNYSRDGGTIVFDLSAVGKAKQPKIKEEREPPPLYLILHLGPPKTGTTSIQCSLRQMEESGLLVQNNITILETESCRPSKANKTRYKHLQARYR